MDIIKVLSIVFIVYLIFDLPLDLRRIGKTGSRPYTWKQRVFGLTQNFLISVINIEAQNFLSIVMYVLVVLSTIGMFHMDKRDVGITDKEYAFYFLFDCAMIFQCISILVR